MKRSPLALAMLAASTIATGNDRAAMYAGAIDNMEKTRAVIQAMQVPALACVAEIERGVPVGESPACAIFSRLSEERIEETRVAMDELQAACENMHSLFADRAIAESCKNLANDSDALFADLERIRHSNSQ